MVRDFPASRWVIVICLLFGACSKKDSSEQEFAQVEPVAAGAAQPSLAPQTTATSSGAANTVNTGFAGAYSSPPTGAGPFRINGIGRDCLHTDSTSPLNRCAILAPAQACMNQLLRGDSNSAAEETGIADRLRVEQRAALFSLSNGLVESAITHYRNAYELALESESPMAEALLRDLAVAQLRSGEVANCLENHNDETCVLPISEKGRHADQTGSLAAIANFEKLLARTPADAQLVWLLNLANMTVGRYPQGVSEQFRIPPDRFRSATSFKRFRNLAPGLGIQTQNMVGSVIVDDFTGDGHLDIVTSSIGPCDSMRLYVNDGRGGFVDKTAGSGLDKQLSAGHIIQADYDNDGRLDIYVTRGLWEKPGTEKLNYDLPVFNSLLRNLGGGRFEDMTAKLGLDDGPSYNIASAWGDFDGDGRVDLFVCDSFLEPKLFLNQKKGPFRKLGPEVSGIRNDQNCMGVAVGDVDADGRPDIYLANHRGDNALFINRGQGKFENANAASLKKPDKAFAAWFSDYDNDGDLDLFVAAWDASDRSLIGRVMIGESHQSEHVHVFRNNGRGEFELVDMGLGDAVLGMAVNVGDFDNDGFEDFLLGTGGPAFDFLLPNRAYRNDAGKRFVDVTFDGGFGNLQKGHGIAFGDLDSDGDQDIVAAFGGWYQGDRFPLSVYENPGFGNNWLTLRLQGVKANRSAIGSRVAVTVNEDGKSRTIYRSVGSGGSFGANSLQVEIGLGRATRIERVQVQWAGSGTKTELIGLAPNRIYRVVEGEKKAVQLESSPFSLNVGGEKIKSHRHH